ncbi:MAG TPA: imidazole glycerol phosphate synthase subunit HisH [Flavisolibacter sp.]
MTIGVIDYGMGNIFSIVKKLQQFFVDTVVITRPAEMRMADKLVLPGVGHFGKAVAHLKTMGIYDDINDAALVKKKPVLGICLGMQLMAERGEEGNAEGFGWFSGTNVRFRVSNAARYKVPQIGWNQLSRCRDSRILAHVGDADEFYFLHAYHLDAAVHGHVICTTRYDYEFPSGIERDNIAGVQFHPEKSHRAGEKVLKNFIDF